MTSTTSKVESNKSKIHRIEMKIAQFILKIPLVIDHREHNKVKMDTRMIDLVVLLQWQGCTHRLIKLFLIANYQSIQLI